MKAVLILFGVSFLINGILYIASGQVLWGLLVLTISAVYFFGFEHIYAEEKWHPASHIFAGGIFALVASSFLVLEKLMSLLSEPQKVSGVDIFFLLISISAFLSALPFKKLFD